MAYKTRKGYHDNYTIELTCACVAIYIYTMYTYIHYNITISEHLPYQYS